MDRFDRHFGTRSCYVHIPFCARVCPYCDFAVVAGRDDLVDRYIAALVAEIDRSQSWEPLDAVFFGGGTPSHIVPARLGQALEVLSVRHGLAGDAEISLEANPEDFTLKRAIQLRSIGFNRVSFGAQSLDGAVLTFLGRRHDGADIDASVKNARDAGFENVSVDLIYGTPGETNASWEDSLGTVVSLEVDHVSCYALTVERGTPLGRAVAEGGEGPDPDVQADRYEMAEAVLAGSGFARYEVSNWAREGRECIYNLTVWAQGEYLAYGNGAHGHRERIRFRNLRRLDAYLDAVEAGDAPRAGEDSMVGWAREIDRLFVGLRRRVGVVHGPGTTALVDSDDGRALLDAGVIKATAERLIVERPLLTDAVHRAVLGLPEPV